MLLPAFLLLGGCRYHSDGDPSDVTKTFADSVQEYFQDHNRLPTHFEELRPYTKGFPADWLPHSGDVLTFQVSSKTTPDYDFGGVASVISVTYRTGGKDFPDDVTEDLRPREALWRQIGFGAYPRDVADALALAIWNKGKAPLAEDKARLQVATDVTDSAPVLKTLFVKRTHSAIEITDDQGHLIHWYPRSGPEIANPPVKPGLPVGASVAFTVP